jgi:hypothetical protein
MIIIEGKSYRAIYVVVPRGQADEVSTIGFCLNEEPSWFDVEQQAVETAREYESAGYHRFAVVRILIEVIE